MQQVADSLGVSKQTVSAAINGKPGITAETRERVLAACERLGYLPDFTARSLATGRTSTIGLIVSDTSSPFIGRLVVIAEDYAHSCGYSLVIYNTHDDVERESAYFQDAMQRRVDGVVFISATDHCPGLDILRTAGIPAVAIDRVPDPYEGTAVMLDNDKTGRLAAEHLLSLGHTRIAHICGPQPETVRMSRERLRGFREVLEAGGVASALRIEPATGWDYEAGYHAMQNLLRQAQRPTAVFAAGDVLAIGALRAAREADLLVPRDLSMVGVDDIDSAAYQNPPLTTIRQSIPELARLGLQLLFDILDGNEPSQAGTVMEPELVMRQSTARPGTDSG